MGVYSRIQRHLEKQWGESYQDPFCMKNEDPPRKTLIPGWSQVCRCDPSSAGLAWREGLSSAWESRVTSTACLLTQLLWDSHLSSGRRNYNNKLSIATMATPSVSISSFNKVKKKDIPNTETVWRMFITNKAPLSAARSKSRLRGFAWSVPAGEANCQ